MGIKKILSTVYAGRVMPWARVVVTENMVYLAGCEGTDPTTGKTLKGIEAQTDIAMQRIKKTLEETGTSMENIVQMLVILKRAEDWEKVEKVMRKYLKPENVPSTLIEAGLAMKRYLVEIQVTAAIPP